MQHNTEKEPKMGQEMFALDTGTVNSYAESNRELLHCVKFY